MENTLEENIANEVKGSLYVMLSTLNQMVNYLPTQLYTFKCILNITTDDPKNETWDNNFKRDYEELNIENCEIPHSEILVIDGIKEHIRRNIANQEIDKIFWNITGGQRPTILAIYDLVKEITDKTHYLCYLEGNSGKLSITKFVEGEEDIEFEGLVEYAVGNLTIKKAFNLMNFDISTHNTPENILENEEFITQLEGFYSIFYPAYKADVNIAKQLTQLNQNNSDLSVVVNGLPNIGGLSKTHIEQQWSNYTHKGFGYLLEDLTLYLLVDAIKKNPNLAAKVAGLYHSTKTNANYLENNQIVDEFDILLLTKQGQVINFECKSGKMTGDVAKSTNYSTYAIAGVYGLPILITPIATVGDIINDKIRKAIAAADRANLTFWHLDNIQQNLENKLLR